MSFQGLRSFREIEFLDEKAGTSKADTRGSVGDGDWGVVAIDFWYNLMDKKKKHLIPLMDEPDEPSESEGNTIWEPSNRTYVKQLVAKTPKSDIGRGEFALYYYFNFYKNAPWLKKAVADNKDIKVMSSSGEMKDQAGYFNWAKVIIGRYSNAPGNVPNFQEFKGLYLGMAQNAKKYQQGTITDADIAYNFVVGKSFIKYSNTMKKQGKGIFTKTPMRAYEGLSKGKGADLVIKIGGKETMVEVKSYPSLTRKIKAGMISDEGKYRPLQMFESMTGFYNLFKAFADPKLKEMKAKAIHGYNLPQIMAIYAKVRNIFKKNPDLKDMDVFQGLLKHLDDLEDIFVEFGNHEHLKGKCDLKSAVKGLKDNENDKNVLEASRIILKGLILHELDRKPGKDGWFMNVDDSLQFGWHKINYDAITDDYDALQTISVEENNLKLNFSKLVKS